MFPSLETQERKGQTEREKGEKIPDSKPKANLKSKTTPASQKSILWLSDTAHPSFYLLVLMAQHPPREDLWVTFPGPTWAPIPQLMYHGWGGAAGPDLRRWGEVVGEGGGQWQLLQQAVGQAG